jgi:hypothetical protein
MSTRRKDCQACGASNPAGSLYCHACGKELVTGQGHEPSAGIGPRGRAGWVIGLVAAGGLLVAAIVTLASVAGASRHKASSYGVQEPSRAVLSLRNRTSDFAMTSLILKDPDTQMVLQQVWEEIEPGGSSILTVAPGSYRVAVSFAEIGQQVPEWPSGSLSVDVTIPAGRAAIVRLEGGHASPDGILYVPPELAVR